MSILDKLRKKEKKVDTVKEKKPESKERKESATALKVSGEKKSGMTSPETTDTKVYRIIQEPIITEKATYLNSLSKYVFKVYPEANKIMIKNAVEKLYKDVKVKDVRIINVRGKKRRLGRYDGRKSGYKKAIVTLKKGVIEVTPIQ